MRVLTPLIILMVLTAFFQGCMTYEKNHTGPGSLLLNQEELEQLFSKKKTFDTDIQGIKVEVTCFPDGTQSLVSRDSTTALVDVGTYTVRDGKKCDQWEKTFGAKKRCFRFNFVSTGKYYLVNPDGSFHAYITMK
jgi:hypothetical protein